MNTAQIKFPHIAALAPTDKATPINPAGKLLLLFCSSFGGFFGHGNSL